MNRLSNVLAIAVWAALTAGTSNAQSTGPGPYFVMPSWDEKLQCDTQAACPRFLVLSNWDNAAVLDRETGLVWERSPSTGTFNWSGAERRCNRLIVSGRMGWRLATVQDLGRLTGGISTFLGPVLPTGHPFSLSQYVFWTATTSAANTSVQFPKESWVATFYNGFPRTATTDQLLGCWCVRGGQGSNPQ